LPQHGILKKSAAFLAYPVCYAHQQQVPQPIVYLTPQCSKHVQCVPKNVTSQLL